MGTAHTETVGLVQELKSTRYFLKNVLKAFSEADSGFAPYPEMFTVAQQVAHIAQVAEWFMDGAFNPAGFDLNFEQHVAEVKGYTSLSEATARMERTFAQAIELVSGKSMAEMSEPLPAGPIMGGAPRLAVVGGIMDHTAHHRGMLSVYLRALGRTPPMPYAG